MLRILPILMAIIFISCRPNSKSSTETVDSAAAAVDFKTRSIPVPFSGSWISATYLQSITTDQSPRKAQETSEECFIILPDQTLKSAIMIYNFHEAIDNLVLVHRGGAFELWEKQNDTLAQAKYLIKKLAEDRMQIGDKIFVKINPVISDQQALILETILFAGQYTSKKGGQVEFKPNGEVVGLGKYKYYQPLTDYFDAGLDIDQVGLGMTPDQMEYFGFKFKKDKLDLFNLKCIEYDPADNRCVSVTFGTKAYELQKTDLK